MRHSHALPISTTVNRSLRSPLDAGPGVVFGRPPGKEAASAQEALSGISFKISQPKCRRYPPVAKVLAPFEQGKDYRRVRLMLRRRPRQATRSDEAGILTTDVLLTNCSVNNMGIINARALSLPAISGL